jgi:hypothetical protein
MLNNLLVSSSIIVGAIFILSLMVTLGPSNPSLVSLFLLSIAADFVGVNLLGPIQMTQFKFVLT